MHFGKVTSKYQITIPSEMRVKENIQVGDRVAFQYNDKGEIVLRPMRKKTVHELGGALYRPDTPYVPIDEARRTTQDDAAIRLSNKENDEN